MQYILLFLTVFIGYILAVFLKTKKRDHIGLYLAFSGAFLLAVTIFELLPEVYEHPSKSIGIFIIIGILLQVVLEFFSKGAEHGHMHQHGSVQQFPIALFISLSIHAFLEGFPIDDSNNIIYGVIIHKIPIAVILSLFFIEAGYKKSTTFLFLILFALMTPLGNFTSNTWDLLSTYSTEIHAVVLGLFLHVSTTILFESSKDHKFNIVKLSTIILAFVLAYFL